MILALLVLLPLVLLVRSRLVRQPSSSSRSVALVVLGDVSRSPRTLAHALSLAKAGFTTHLVAFPSPSSAALTDVPNLRFVAIAPFPIQLATSSRAVFLALAPVKIVYGALSLFYALAFAIDRAPAYYLVQNPPAIPTLPLVQLVALLRGSGIIIDWHNTGDSMLALRYGGNTRHPVVRVATWIEHRWGRDADAHLCVTKAMKAQLMSTMDLRGRVKVFYDRPPAHFRRLTDLEIHNFILRHPIFSLPTVVSFLEPSTPESTPFTHLSTSPFARGAEFHISRPALLVSSTSWTEDEDFGMLLVAVEHYEEKLAGQDLDASKPHARKILVVITGKGPLKAAFEAKVAEAEKRWKYVRIVTAWLETEDYPLLLGSADLGISFHTSTSGADLPMKVVDMFGCGLPALCLGFPCLPELVQEGKNGRIFRTGTELAQLWLDLLPTLEQYPSDLDIMAAGIKAATFETESGKAGWCTWEEEWERVVRPLVEPGGTMPTRSSASTRR